MTNFDEKLINMQKYNLNLKDNKISKNTQNKILNYGNLYHKKYTIPIKSQPCF